MNKEEAKKMGATHYDNGYYYWYGKNFIYKLVDGEWLWSKHIPVNKI